MFGNGRATIICTHPATMHSTATTAQTYRV